jgi:hypothetical protein
MPSLCRPRVSIYALPSTGRLIFQMALPRTFVGFSSTDISYYRLMCAWKAHENIDFDFCDCQLQTAINSDNETYIKSRCRDRLQMAGTHVLLIGADTAYKEKFVL